VNGTLHVGMAALGAALGGLGYVETLRRGHLDPDHVRLPWVVALSLALVLSRLAFALERGLAWGETLRPAPGGYILYGALPALGVVPIWLRLRGVEPGPYIDRAAPWIVLGLVPARLGCWIVGCCPGVSIDGGLPAWLLPGRRVPVSLLAALLHLGLGLVLLERLRRGGAGGTAALALFSHGALRTLLDPLRERSVTQTGVALPLAAWGLTRFWQTKRARRTS
jgi:prolipoprotein diacylglyceryltransferase